MDASRPKVGLGIMVVRGSEVLMGRRRGSHGAGEYAWPGGHLEPGESFEDAVRRELAEEVGAQFEITEPEFLCVTNLRRYLPKHYVDIGMTARWISGQPQLMEPDKCDGWDWYDIALPPRPLFGTVGNYLQAYLGGVTYFTA